VHFFGHGRAVLKLRGNRRSVALAPSAALADAAATAIGNAVKSAQDIEKGLALARGIAGLKGAVIIVGDAMGAWGDIQLHRLE
jgi:ApbE superfamily uncharacterized protein (UPF0280 family)